MAERIDVDVDWSGQEVICSEECWRLLGSSPVGRIGFVDEGSPVILPVNIALDGHGVVFRSAPGSMLDMAIMERGVCVEVDHWDPMAHTGWSVLAKGVPQHVVDRETVERLEQLPVMPWSRPDLRVEWIRVTVEEISGRRIGPIAG